MPTSVSVGRTHFSCLSSKRYNVVNGNVRFSLHNLSQLHKILISPLSSPVLPHFFIEPTAQENVWQCQEGLERGFLEQRRMGTVVCFVFCSQSFHKKTLYPKANNIPGLEIQSICLCPVRSTASSLTFNLHAIFSENLYPLMLASHRAASVPPGIQSSSPFSYLHFTSTASVIITCTCQHFFLTVPIPTSQTDVRLHSICF